MILPALRAALRHLTVLPVPYDARETTLPPARTLPYFPIVGLAIGVVAGAVLLLPLPSLPRAALALLVWTAVTGGFHEDGFLDCADAALAPVSRERRLAILDDPHVGAHAATAGALLLIARFAALTVVPAYAVPVAAMLGRWSMVATLSRGRPARLTGLGAAFADGARPGSATIVALVGLLAIGVVTDPLSCALAGLAAMVAGPGTAAFLARRFGGVTGDVHGAAGLIAETAALYAYVAGAT